MIVYVKDEDIERAITKLKKKVEKAGILKDFRRSTFHETRRQRRKRKDQIALRRMKKRLRQEKTEDERNNWTISLDVHGLCKYLGISIATAYRLIKKKNGVPCCRVGGTWRFIPEEIDQWVRSKRK